MRGRRPRERHDRGESRLRPILALAAALLLAARATAAPPPPPPLRLATYAYPKYDRAAALAPLAALIERVAGRKVEVVLLETPDALRDAVLAGRVDVAVPNLAAWLGMRANPAAVAIARLDVPAATLER